MACKCKYFTIKDGALVCSVCGKPAKIEDKATEKHEDKAIKKHEDK